MNFPGTLKEDGDGFECASCGEKIEQGERCFRVDYAEVQTNEIGNPRAQSKNFAGIYHPECL